jgi:hypothetical protein
MNPIHVQLVIIDGHGVGAGAEGLRHNVIEIAGRQKIQSWRQVTQGPVPPAVRS